MSGTGVTLGWLCGTAPALENHVSTREANQSVAPGNLGNYDLFVLSTSTNRKLVLGTKVIYRVVK